MDMFEKKIKEAGNEESLTKEIIKMSDIKWIKIATNIFDDEKILLIESLPAADSIITIWFKLLALAGKQNNDGVFLLNDKIAYTEEMLSAIFRRDLSIVRLALNTFEEFGMVEIINGVITIPNWNKHQTLDSYEKKKERDRIYQAERRAQQKKIASKSCRRVSDDLSNDLSDDQSSCVAVSDIEEDKDNNISISPNGNIDIVGGASADRGDGADPERKQIDYQHVMTDFNDTCIDFPMIHAMSEARKKKIRTLLNEFKILKIWPDVTNYDRLHRLFEMAQDSNFLSGRDQKWNGCSFDWIINKTNALKIIEGNYKNKEGCNHGGNSGAGTVNAGTNCHSYYEALESTTRGALERFRRNDDGTV